MTIASKKFFSYIEHEEDTGFVFKDTKTIDIPPLFAQPGNKRQGWNAKNIERYLAFLFSLLGAGRGGDVDLSDKTKKPLWFSSKVDYRKFKCASYASMDDNVDLIRKRGSENHVHLRSPRAKRRRSQRN